MRLFLFLLTIGLASLAAGELRYLPANKAQSLVRRDLIPLDVDAIGDLAARLTIIVDGPFPKTASQLHHRARALTLSRRLLPSQPQARAIEDASLEKKDRPAVPESDSKPAMEAILETADWLTLLPADSEGHHLGQLLLDIIQPLVVDHPILKRRDPAQAAGRWNSVIPGIQNFESEDKPEKPKQPLKTESNQRRYAITALLTEIPMISTGEEEGSEPVADLVTTSLVVTRAPFLDPEGENEEPTERAPGRLLFKPKPTFAVDPLHQSLLDFFETHLDPLPAHSNLNINTTRRRYLARNRENIIAPIAMMLDSAVTGRSLRRNTILFADLRPNGSLKRPAQAWELLLCLDELKLPAKTRLIVGSGMVEELTALLVLEKASFFNKFEVLEAPTYEDARALFFDDEALPAELQAASDGYREVREKADLATNLGTFLSLASVEQRLVKASELSPRHLSAKVLATQTVRRPAYFSATMAALDLDRRLEPLSLLQFDLDKTTMDDIGEAYKNARAAIDPIERFLELSDRKLYNEAVSLLKKLNSIDRRASSAEPEDRQAIRQRDFNNFQDQLEDFRKSLRESARESRVSPGLKNE